MTDVDAFEVDADALTRAVDDIQSCHATLSALAGDLERRVAALHLSWAGEAAQAHRAAQAAWAGGFADMRESLDRMRAAGRTAHANYTSAAATNLRMWEQVG